MWIDKLAIYKYDREWSESKKQKPLKMSNHLINEDMIKICKLETLINTLKETWDCSQDDVQVQIRFVPQGTKRDEV